MTTSDQTMHARARELLAREYEQNDFPTCAALARAGKGAFTLCSIRAIEAALANQEARSAGDGWLPIETAPKDDTLVELVVDYSDGDHPLSDAIRACTIGFNGYDNHGVDEWKFAGWCWTHDHFVQGKGKVLAWRPSRLNACDDALPPLPEPPTTAHRGEG